MTTTDTTTEWIGTTEFGKRLGIKRAAAAAKCRRLARTTTGIFSRHDKNGGPWLINWPAYLTWMNQGGDQ